MKIKSGILVKLFAWYLLACLIFYGTILFLFVHIQELGKISEDIANQKYRIATASKKRIENISPPARKNTNPTCSKSCGSVRAELMEIPGRVYTGNTRSSSNPARNRPMPNIPTFPG